METLPTSIQKTNCESIHSNTSHRESTSKFIEEAIFEKEQLLIGNALDNIEPITMT